jgi:hypothetical protein
MRSIARWIAACAAGLLLVWIALAVQTAAAQQGVPRDALLRFEENVKWEAVSADWVGQRDRWIAAVQSARSPADVAAQVLALEAATKWSAVEPDWRQMRDGWVARLQAVQ